MARFHLCAHLDHPPSGVDSVVVDVLRQSDESLRLEYAVRGEEHLLLPAPAKPERADELWRTTCFEVFLRPCEAPRYFEYNLSPSFQWAAYAFDDYRQGKADQPVAWNPKIEVTPTDGSHFFLYSELDVSMVRDGRAHLALSAVIEEVDGTKSYWALAHAPGPPDFHNPACFTAMLPPPAVP